VQRDLNQARLLDGIKKVFHGDLLKIFGPRAVISDTSMCKRPISRGTCATRSATQRDHRYGDNEELHQRMGNR